MDYSKLTFSQITALGRVSETATSVCNSLLATLKAVSDEAVTLLWHNKDGLSPQEICDHLSEQGVLENLYAVLTFAQAGLYQFNQSLLNFLSNFEVIPFREDGKFGLVVTTVPFELGRHRFEEQTSRADAEALAETLSAETPES